MPTISQTTADTLLNNLLAAIDGGAANPTAQLAIYTNTQPSSPDVAAGATPILTIALNNPAFLTATTGQLVLAGTPFGIASGSGTPTWGRLVNRDNVPVIDFSIGPTGAVDIVAAGSLLAGSAYSLSTLTLIF